MQYKQLRATQDQMKAEVLKEGAYLKENNGVFYPFITDEGKQFQSWLIFMPFVAGFVCVTSASSSSPLAPPIPPHPPNQQQNPSYFRAGINEAKIFNY